jgi:transcriptional regulator with XRE-family HTH domain
VKSIDNQLEKSKRFVEIMNHFNLNQAEMAVKTGLSQPKVSEIKNLKAGVNILNDIFYRLHYEFNISKEWWESGKGLMINKIDHAVTSSKQDIAQETNQVYDSEYWKNEYIAIQKKYTALLENRLIEVLGNDKRSKAG